MRRRSQIYMLPSDKKSRMAIVCNKLTHVSNEDDNPQGHYFFEKEYLDEDAHTLPQNLYFTIQPINDDFDINQWVIFEGSEIFQIFSMTADYLYTNSGKQYDPDYCEVIVATTDLELYRKKVYRTSKKGETLHQDTRGTYEWVKVMDQPSEEFIKEYCNSDIYEVKIEFENVGSNSDGYGLITDPKDGSIIIHRIKDWSDEDPIQKSINLITDTINHVFEGDAEKLDNARNWILGDISEILRNCIDHDEPEKATFYLEVKKAIENYE